MLSEHVPTIFENYTADYTIDGVNVKLTLKDTAGQEEYGNLLGCSYEGSDAFIITMAVDVLASLDNAIEKWHAEICEYLEKNNIEGPPNVIFALNKWDLQDDDEKEK